MQTIAKPEFIRLTDEQENIKNLIEESQHNFFITGKAGTGKSTLLQEFKKQSKKQIVLVAPTGIAALNIGGQTIHSLFGIKPADIIEAGTLRTTKAVRDTLAKVDTVIIDEVSMLRADLMDAMDEVLRFSKRSEQAFGGVQVLMFGDLFQLPPVVRGKDAEKYFQENYGGVYFFNAKVWQQTKLEICELSKNIRQENDQKFTSLLNQIRNKSIDAEGLACLNQRTRFKADAHEEIILALTNKAVDSINSSKLAALNTEEFSYQAEISGTLRESEFPTEKNLKLKLGARVMLLKNNKEEGYANGSLATVVELNSKAIFLDINGTEIELKPASWQKIKYFFNEETGKVEEEIISSFKQFPIKLAWAITVHKSQGQTLENVTLDMGYGAFAHGQTYVALSRCRSLNDLHLKKPIKEKDLILDHKVLEFLEQEA